MARKPKADPLPPVAGADAIANDPPIGGAQMVTDVDSNIEANGGGVAEALDQLKVNLDSAEKTDIDRMVDRVMTVINEAGFSAGTAVGDVRDVMLDSLRQNQKPWSQLSESDQRQIAQGFEAFALSLIERVAIIVATDAARGTQIRAKLDNYGEGKGGLKLSLSVSSPRDMEILALHKATGKMVILQQADASDYNGESRPPAIDPDQPNIDFEGGGQPNGDDTDLADGATEALDAIDHADGYNLYDPVEREWLTDGDAFSGNREEAAIYMTREAAETEKGAWNDVALEIVAVGQEPEAA